jgi:hypothetical protein
MSSAAESLGDFKVRPTTTGSPSAVRLIEYRTVSSRSYTDMAVWRPSTGAWYVSGVTSLTCGGAGDIPVPADYDGDGRADFGIWRPVTGEWFIYTAAGVVQPVHVWGGNGDIPVPAGYDNNLSAELAVWRPSDGTYYIRNVGTVQWGQAGDVPIQKRPAYPGYPY